METIVLYTIPDIGHIIPMVELAKLILSQNSSLSIIILTPHLPIIISSVSSYISSVSSAFPSISFHSLPEVSLVLGDPYKQPNRYEIIRRNGPNFRDFLQSLSLISHVSAIILDFFCYPGLEVARCFDIPTYFYLTSGASVVALLLNLPSFVSIASDSFRNLGHTLFEIPGLFSVPASQMIESTLDRGVNHDELVSLGLFLPKSDGIIINSFESLEPRVVKALKEGVCLVGSPVPPVFCVGPLVANNGGNEVDKGSECLSWLDSQPNGSVVYLSFGSMGVFTRKQTREIAIGLERSEVRFLWVVRAPISEDKSKQLASSHELDLCSILPDGFLDRTKDRGFIVKSWAPQIAILAHKAIGGFVTHCGWNSTLESVCAGVPLVAWPLYAEQRFNKILLVQELKIALPMNESDDRFVSSDEIEKRVKQITNSEEGVAIREKMIKLSEDAKLVLSEGGSSIVALAKFMESWK